MMDGHEKFMNRGLSVQFRINNTQNSLNQLVLANQLIPAISELALQNGAVPELRRNRQLPLRQKVPVRSFCERSARAKPSSKGKKTVYLVFSKIGKLGQKNKEQLKLSLPVFHCAPDPQSLRFFYRKKMRSGALALRFQTFLLLPKKWQK